MIKIITDSTSDLSAARAKELGVEVLPLTVHFGGELFRDGVDITNKEFYARLSKSEKLPTTSQINPEVFEQKFRRRIEGGDQVLGIFISGELSGTCQSANIARNMVDSRNIAVVDSRLATFPMGLIVEMACKLRDEGLGLEELTERLNALIPRVRLLAVVDTLKYLKMGGRISAATAVVGGMLGITPIITLQDGKVESIGKSRGRKAAFAWMEKWMEKEPMDPSLPVSFGHSAAPRAMADCMAYFKDAVEGRDCFSMDIGSVVGTHAGPGATGIAYFVAE